MTIRSRFVFVMLLLPLVYVGSYLLLVRQKKLIDPFFERYRFGGEYSERIFWPLDQLVRKLRPGTWPNSPFGFVGDEKSSQTG